jgi:hypothetical protein
MLALSLTSDGMARKTWERLAIDRVDAPDTTVLPVIPRRP